MPVYRVQGPGGAVYRIEGPEGATQDQILAYAQQQFADSSKQSGFWESAKEGATTIGSLPEALKFGATNTLDARDALVADQTPAHAKTSWADVKDVPSFVNWTRQTAGTSMGYLAAPGAAGAIAQGLSKTPGVGKAVGVGLLGAQYLTENLGRQAGEQQISESQGQAMNPASIGRAALAAAGQTGLDVVGFKFFEPAFKALPFVGKLFGKEGSAAAQEAADTLADAMAKQSIKYGESIATGIGRGVVFEVPQEIAQQALERLQAGLSLSDESARREYVEAMAGAILLGGGLGGLQGAVETHNAHNEAGKIVDRVKGRDATAQQEQRTAKTQLKVTKPGGVTVPATSAVMSRPEVKALKQTEQKSEAVKQYEQMAKGGIDPENPLLMDSSPADPNIAKAQAALEAISPEGVVPATGGIKAIAQATGLPYPAAGVLYNKISTKKDGVRRLHTITPPPAPPKPVDTGGLSGPINDEIPAGKDVIDVAKSSPANTASVDPKAVGAGVGVSAQEGIAKIQAAADAQPRGVDDTVSDTGGTVEGEGGVGAALRPERPEGRIIGPEIQLTDQERAELEAAPNVAEKWVERPTTKPDEGAAAFLADLDAVRKRIPVQPDTLLARNRLDTIERDLQRGKPLDEKSVRDLQKYAERFPQTEAPPPAAPGPAELKQGKPIEDIVALVEADERTAKEERVEVINHKTGKIETKTRPVRNKIQQILTRLSETGNGAYSALAKQMRDLEELFEDTGPNNTPERGKGNWNIDKPPRAKTTEKFLNPRIIIEGSKTDDPQVIARLKAEGKVAEYNASKNEFAFTREGLTDKVFLHEFVHAFTVKNLKQYARDASKLSTEQRLAARQIFTIYEQAKKSDLKSKYPEAFDNIYEFVSYAMTEPQMQADLKQMKAKPVYTAGLDPRKTDVSSLTARKTTFDLWSKFTQAVAKLLGFGRNAVKAGADNYGNALLELTEAVGEIMAVPMKVTGVGRLAAKSTAQVYTASDLAQNTAADVIQGNLLRIEETHGPYTIKDSVKYFMTMPGYENLVRRFQNDRRPLKLLQDVLWMSGNLLVGKNNIFDALTLSTQVAHWAMTNHLMEPMNRINSGVAAYSQLRNITAKEALAELDAYFVAEHETERRHDKYLRFVPLENVDKFPIPELGAEARTAHTHRAHIYNDLLTDPELDKKSSKEVPEAKRLPTPERLKELLDAIVEQHRDTEGTSDFITLNADQKADQSALDEQSDLYSVIKVDPQALAELREEYAERRETLGDEIDDIKSAMRDMFEQTIKLNRDANYWSAPVDNFQRFYGWKNYVPYKGKPNFNEKDADAVFEPFTDRTGGGFEFIEAQEGFAGRKSMADNVILQTMVDGAKSALRYGRKDVAPALKNLIDSKYIYGESGDTGKDKEHRIISFADRYKNPSGLKLGGPDEIFLYRDDGKIEVLKIHNSHKHYREAIRRSYREPMPVINFMNQVTGVMGHMHTRYNPAFHPYNFVRDALTNAFKMGAEYAPALAGKYLSAVAQRVAGGGMGAARKISWLYANGRIAEIEDLANEKTPRGRYAKEIYEYLRTGGRVAYIMGVAHKGQLSELMKDVGESDFKQRWEGFKKYVDVWADLFEFTSRAAAFAVFKQHYMSEAGGKLEPWQATQKAAADAKNLANFEQIGTAGREAGALFMFFRPAATGAVAALDAVKTVWWNEQNFIEQLPNVLAQKDNPARANLIAKHREMKKNAQLMLGGIAGAGFMLYMMAALAAQDDDEVDEFGRNKVLKDDMTLWTRNLRVPLSLVNKDSKAVLQLPWGFGLGGVGAMGAQLAGLTMGRQSTWDFFGNMVNIALDSYIPIPVSRISPVENPSAWVVDSLMPSVIRPLVEFTMNTDGLGREIYNNRVTKYGDAALGSANVPEGYHKAARLLRDITNGEVNIQPNSMYFWANNYLDGLSRITMNTYGLGLTVSGDKQFEAKTDLMLLSSFMGRESNLDARQFAAVKKQIDEQEANLNQFSNNEKQLTRYLERNPHAPAAVYMFRQIESGALRQLRTATNEVKASNELTARERKEIVDDLTQLQNAIKYQAIKQLKLYGVEP